MFLSSEFHENQVELVWSKSTDSENNTKAVTTGLGEAIAHINRVFPARGSPNVVQPQLAVCWWQCC